MTSDSTSNLAAMLGATEQSKKGHGSGRGPLTNLVAGLASDLTGGTVGWRRKHV